MHIKRINSNNNNNYGNHKEEPQASLSGPLCAAHARRPLVGKPGGILTMRACLSQCHISSNISQSSMFVNLVFFLCLVMSITRPDEVEPTMMALIVNVLSIIHDIIWISHVGDATPAKYWKGWYMFGAIMTIFNLIARLPTTFLLYTDFKQMSNKS